MNRAFTLVVLMGAIAAGSAAAADLPGDAVPVQPAETSFFIVNDTSISYWHQFSADEPGVGTNIDKDIGSLTHFDVWKYGTNFVNVDFLKSDQNDPSENGDGAFEVYGLFRSTLSWNSMFDTGTFTAGPLKDVSFYFGGDANTKNTDFDPKKLDIVAGLQLTVGLYDTGYLNLAPVYYKEWNHNGITSQDVEFDGTFRLEADYAQPLGDLPLTIRGYTNITAPKGNDGFGVATKTEFHTENRFVLDVSKIAAEKLGIFDLFVGHTYWQNKFGSNHKTDSTDGSTENTFFVGVTWHLY